MVSARSKKAHAIFVAALERPEDERNAYVVAACEADALLQREVNQLFSAVAHSTDFLETPAIDAKQRTAANLAATPTVDVPGYRIIRTLGAGGMARVYEAEQQHPKRLVALKVMHRSLRESSALQRFRFEIEVLARLKHPGIAQIYEAGTIDDEAGRPLPFFSMELVDDALPLTQHATEADLALPRRLALFADICDAVRSGHNAGVVHRDLKPTNVLVNGAGQVKIIDFGIARSLDPVEATITIESDRTQLIGTLNYMSPEQCAGSDVDTRCDVYSLGVMLYELVTDKLPHDLSQTSITEAVRVIQDVAPARPGSVIRNIPSDLELIIMTAIDKDRARRYPSAAEFAADIRRFLNHEPIHARPPTVIYKARKFAQRHRALVAGSAFLAFVLITAALVSTRMAIVANRARLAAELREQMLQRATEFNREQLRNLDIAAMGSRIRESLLKALVPGSMTLPESEELLEEINFPSLALAVVQEDLLEPSRHAIDERFNDHPLLRAEMLQSLAKTMNALGLPDRAMPVLEDALAIRLAALGPDHHDTLESVNTMGLLHGYLGDYEAAHDRLRDTYERRARILGAQHPETLGTANSLGGALRRLGRLEEAAEIWTSTLNARRRILGDDDPATLISLNNVGVIHAIQGDLDGAEAAWGELLERRKRLYGADHPKYRNGLTNYGLILLEQGKLTEARPYLEQALDGLLATKGESHPSTLSTMASLAELLVELDDPQAGSLMERCLRGRSEAFGPDHPDTLRSRAHLAAFAASEGKYAEATKELKSVLAIQRKVLGEEHGDVIDVMHLLADALLGLGDYEAAYEYAADSVRRSKALTPDAHVAIATLVMVEARALVALKRFDEAEAALVAAHAALVDTLGAENTRTQAVAAALAELKSERSGESAETPLNVSRSGQ